MRIALMILSVIFVFPIYLIRLAIFGKSKNWEREKAYAYIQKRAKKANIHGRVIVDVHGVENLPEKDGFVLFPNHQGMYDVLVFLDSCPRPFAFVAKKEIKNVPLLKQCVAALHSLLMDRHDLRQSMEIIKEMTRRIEEGENFLIFAEGTRSKMGNKMNEMKAGSFKCAVKAKAPIVPVALMDCFVPFDENSIKKVTVKAFYLKPMYYDEYKDMSTQEIAAEVKHRIEETIAANS
ncbi:1-acyl-sn-glycerol-3-phosphate acyltransferase [Lachnospiraceae bacterium YSD2013]|nr:1-acyl-sn-glycerol-3-phosphate acyltransferase [Lachnospiraceae bacterium YSD2013]